MTCCAILTAEAMTTMNRYGLRARNHWARWLPTRYAQIEDPDSFFASLGQEAADRIQDLMMDLAGDDPAGEGYLEKQARMTTAQMEAEGQVLREMILLEPEPGMEGDPAPAAGNQPQASPA